MSEAPDRQAKALERIELNTRKLASVLEALNDNLVVAFKFVKTAIQEDHCCHVDPNQMSLDELRAKAEREEYEARTGETWVEKTEKDREQRAAYEESARNDPAREAKEKQDEDYLRPGVTDPFKYPY